LPDLACSLACHYEAAYPPCRAVDQSTVVTRGARLAKCDLSLSEGRLTYLRPLPTHKGQARIRIEHPDPGIGRLCRCGADTNALASMALMLKEHSEHPLAGRRTNPTAPPPLQLCRGDLPVGPALAGRTLVQQRLVAATGTAPVRRWPLAGAHCLWLQLLSVAGLQLLESTCFSALASGTCASVTTRRRGRQNLPSPSHKAVETLECATFPCRNVAPVRHSLIKTGTDLGRLTRSRPCHVDCPA